MAKRRGVYSVLKILQNCSQRGLKYGPCVGSFFAESWTRSNVLPYFEQHRLPGHWQECPVRVVSNLSAHARASKTNQVDIQGHQQWLAPSQTTYNTTPSRESPARIHYKAIWNLLPLEGKSCSYSCLCQTFLSQNRSVCLSHSKIPPYNLFILNKNQQN